MPPIGQTCEKPRHRGKRFGTICTRDMADLQPPAPPHPRVVKFRSRLASVKSRVDMYAVPRPCCTGCSYCLLVTVRTQAQGSSLRGTDACQSLTYRACRVPWHHRSSPSSGSPGSCHIPTRPRVQTVRARGWWLRWAWRWSPRQQSLCSRGDAGDPRTRCCVLVTLRRR